MSGRRWTHEASPVVDGIVERLSVVDDRLDAVQLADGRAISRAALFIRPALHARADGLVESLGCEVDEGGFVRVDATGQTSVPGVWAAGNVCNPRAQVITAAGEGSAAAIAINTDLVEEDVASTQSTRLYEPKGLPMTDTTENPPARVSPPSKHQLAVMIWLCVFPTLTAINLAFARLAPTDVAGAPHLRPRNDRGADRDLRTDAVPPPAPREAPDDGRVTKNARD